jgi:hypothetical protein
MPLPKLLRLPLYEAAQRTADRCGFSIDRAKGPLIWMEQYVWLVQLRWPVNKCICLT